MCKPRTSWDIRPTFSLLHGDQRDGQQRGKNTDHLPARKMFMQNEARQQNRNDRIERAQYNRRVQTSGLFGANKERGAR